MIIALLILIAAWLIYSAIYLVIDWWAYNHLGLCEKFYKEQLKKFGMSFVPHLMGERPYQIMNNKCQLLVFDNYWLTLKFVQKCIDTSNADFAQPLFDKQEDIRKRRMEKEKRDQIPRKYRSLP